MSTFADIYHDKKPAADPLRPIQIREEMDDSSCRVITLHDSKIQALVRHLFLRPDAKPVRHVGFVPVEDSTSTSQLCLDAARCLADQGRYDVALIDCSAGTALASELKLASPSTPETSWLIAPRLWVVTRDGWTEKSNNQSSNEYPSRLASVTSEFDFSILRCESASNFEMSEAQACDGIVLVLTANKTRRLVAMQIKDKLEDMQIPLLGSVLADRRFPVPQGLYQNL